MVRAGVDKASQVIAELPAGARVQVGVVAHAASGGMTRAQVKYLLGSPLIEDSFHPDRWDYFYSFRTGKGLYETRRVTLLFSGQTLTSVEKTPTTEIELDYW